MLDLGSLQVQGQHQCMLSLLLSCTLLGMKALLHCISPTIPRPSQVLHTATVALVISQVLDCKYAGCYAAVVTNICQDAGCIPGSAFGACTYIYSHMLLAQAAASSTASVSLKRPPDWMQLTLSAAVSYRPTCWFHGASNPVRTSVVKLTGPRSALELRSRNRTAASCCWSSQIGCSHVYVSK